MRALISIPVVLLVGCSSPAPQGVYTAATLHARYDLGRGPGPGVMAIADVAGDRGLELIVVPNAEPDASRGDVLVFDGGAAGGVGREASLVAVSVPPNYRAWSLEEVGSGAARSLLVVGLDVSVARAFPLPIQGTVDATAALEDPRWRRPTSGGWPFADRLVGVAGVDAVGLGVCVAGRRSGPVADLCPAGLPAGGPDGRSGRGRHPHRAGRLRGLGIGARHRVHGARR